MISWSIDQIFSLHQFLWFDHSFESFLVQSSINSVWMFFSFGWCSFIDFSWNLQWNERWPQTVEDVEMIIFKQWNWFFFSFSSWLMIIFPFLSFRKNLFIGKDSFQQSNGDQIRRFTTTILSIHWLRPNAKRFFTFFHRLCNLLDWCSSNLQWEWKRFISKNFHPILRCLIFTEMFRHPTSFHWFFIERKEKEDETWSTDEQRSGWHIELAQKNISLFSALFVWNRDKPTNSISSVMSILVSANSSFIIFPGILHLRNHRLSCWFQSLWFSSRQSFEDVRWCHWEMITGQGEQLVLVPCSTTEQGNYRQNSHSDGTISSLFFIWFSFFSENQPYYSPVLFNERCW